MSTAIESILYNGKGIVNPSSVVVNTSFLPQTTFQVSGTTTLQGPLNVQGGLVYPPTGMTTNSTVVSGQAYGNGTYVASFSTADFGAGTTAWYSFSRSLTATNSTSVVYTAGGGGSPYSGSTSTTDTNTNLPYSGAYIQIQFPAATPLAYYSMCGASAAETRMPSVFYVFGSSNGTTWYLVDSRSSQTWSAPQVFNTYYPSGPSAGTAFSYWRLVINTLQGNWGNGQVCQWFLYGPQLSSAATYVVGGNVGIGTTTPSASLQVFGNVAISGNIYYTDDIFKRGPYLVPSAANANAITAWISSTCNASSTVGGSSWWSTSQTPVYGNVATGPKGTSDYGGSVLLPDGRVLFVPQSASNVGFFNPATGTFSAVVPVGLGTVSGQFRCGVLVPNGNVVFVPWNSSNVGLFNPVTYAYANIAVGASPASGCFQGAVLSPTGNVVMVPRGSANIGIFNPTTRTLTNVGPIAGAANFGSGVLLPNGNVFMTPIGAANVGMYNTASYVASGFSNIAVGFGALNLETTVLAPNGNVVCPPSTWANAVMYSPSAGTFSNIVVGGAGSGNFFQGGTLLPSGNIICCPADASNVGMIDPVARTYSNCAFVSTATGKFYGCTLIPDGRVVFTPASSANVGVLNTLTPAPVEFCRAPYFNKF